jgi:hypothetical protein
MYSENGMHLLDNVEVEAHVGKQVGKQKLEAQSILHIC